MSTETTPTPVDDTLVVDTDATAESTTAESGFSRSMLISATRCLLTYIVFPFVAPAIGLASDIGPGIGIVIGVVALYFNVTSLRRFWVSRHRLRIPMTVIHLGVMTLLTILIVDDLRALFG